MAELQELLEAYLTRTPSARRSGGEWKGPCPVCGGDDRFWISETKLGCRGCRPGKNNPAAFLAIVKALGARSQEAPDLDPDMLRRNNRKLDQWRRKKRGCTVEMAQQAWRRAAPPEGTAAAAYLCQVRVCWPPSLALPVSVRWLRRAQLPIAKELPREAAGAVVFAFTDETGQLAGMDLEALTAGGQRPARRWRRSCGLKGRGLFRLEAPGAELQVTEGAVNALAARWLRNGPAVATGGTSVDALAAVTQAHARIHVDGDPGGRKWALSALDALPARAVVEIAHYAEGTDAADRWKNTLQASAAYRESYDIAQGAGTAEVDPETHKEATLAAWSHHLPQLNP